MEVAFVYPNPRSQLAAEVAAGKAPDTALLGQNHLADFGIEARIHEPALRRVDRLQGLRHILTWHARELTLPWELRDVDAAVTPLVNLFPLSARLRGRPSLLLIDYGIATTWRRASPLRRALLKASLQSCAAIACLGRSQRDDLVAEIDLEPSQIHVVHLGVDERFFRPASRVANGYVLAVGKDLARDYATLARAAELLGVRVRIVAHRRNLQGVALPANVETAGGLTWEGLREAYAGAACVVLPLRPSTYPYGTDGSGLTTLVEAMAMAKPLVVTERPIFRDYVQDGQSCLHVPPGDAEALANAIQRVVTDTELAAELGSRCRRLVEGRFTTRHLAARLANLLRSLA